MKIDQDDINLPEFPPQREQVHIYHISSEMAWKHAL